MSHPQVSRPGTPLRRSLLALIVSVSLPLLFLLLALTLQPVSSASRAVFTVTKTADTNDGVCDADCSLREAIDAANSNGGADFILFDNSLASPITLGGNQLVIQDDVTIRCGPQPIDGANLSRIFEIDSGVTQIEGCTLTQGETDFGDFPDYSGGAIWNKAHLTLADSQLTRNVSFAEGGAIYNTGILTVVRTTIDSNAADSGGGIANTGIASIMSSTVTTNDAAGFSGGGGVYADVGSTTIINRSEVSFNTAAPHGGGLLTYGTLTLTSSDVVSNSAASRGGGIVIESANTPAVLTGVSISGNSARSAGGVYINRIGVVIENATVMRNTVTAAAVGTPGTPGDDGDGLSSPDPGGPGGSGFDGGAGGGIYLDTSASVVISSTTIAQNTAGDGGCGGNGGSGGNGGTGQDGEDGGHGGPGGDGGDGGGIYNSGVVTLTVSTIISNTTGNGGCGGNGGFGGDGGQSFGFGTDGGNGGDGGDGGAPGYGAGIYSDGTMVLGRSTIADNSVGASGAAGNGGAGGSGDGGSNGSSGGPGNPGAGAQGGGLYLAPLPPDRTVIYDSTVRENTSTFSGGGVFSEGELSVWGSTLFSNTASTLGGAFYILNGDAVITNSTISGNTAPNGAGVRNFGGTTTVTNTTIANNISSIGTGIGGGIYNTLGTINASNMLLSANIPADCYVTGVFNPLFTNQDSDGTCPGFTPGAPLLGPLANNGGSTLTHMPVAGSTAIDTGTNLVCASIGNVDQRGYTRVGVGAACDLGSVEANAPAPTAVTLRRADTLHGDSAAAVTFAALLLSIATIYHRRRSMFAL